MYKNHKKRSITKYKKRKSYLYHVVLELTLFLYYFSQAQIVQIVRLLKFDLSL